HQFPLHVRNDVWRRRSRIDDFPWRTVVLFERGLAGDAQSERKHKDALWRPVSGLAYGIVFDLLWSTVQRGVWFAACNLRNEMGILLRPRIRSRHASRNR